MSEHVLTRLATRIFNTPLMIEPHKARVILTALRSRFGVALELPIDAAYVDQSEPQQRRPYEVVDGTAIIDVMGSLVHRSMGLDAWSGLTSYVELSAELDQALTDTEVTRVLFLIDSPGGEADGVFDLADKIFAARDKKKMVALVDGLGCSAAYALAAACETVYATQGALLGSIGVILEHVDMSQANAAAGLVVTEIYAGARKADGSPNHPLSPESSQALQQLVDNTYALFVNKVAQYRGLQADAVRATEAGLFMGEQAITAGLADAITTLETLLKEHTMSKESQTVMTLERLKTEHADLVEQIRTEAHVAGQAAERARVVEVLDVCGIELDATAKDAIESGATAEATAVKVLKASRSAKQPPQPAKSPAAAAYLADGEAADVATIVPEQPQTSEREQVATSYLSAAKAVAAQRERRLSVVK